ncbi:MAG: HDOD domain-containing protein [Candidatus Eisenbacteria sp.]|nr:HDOD domain-containing protein [Candidatus Eisenbacteria bacterium]
MVPFRDRLESELGRVGDLPTLPAVVTSLERALSDQSSDASDVARIISQDPSLAANILRVANSAFYAGAAGTITSIAGAVARLGFSETRSLCVTIAVVRSFGHIGQHMDHRQFWKHSIVAAVATRVIAGFCNMAGAFSQDDAYVAGLLHDIGALVLDQYFPDDFQDIRAMADEHCVPYAVAEYEVLQVDHGEIGGYLLRRWNLPESIVRAVSYHHQPFRAGIDHRPLVQTVHLADAMCTSLGIGDGADGVPAGFSNGAWYDLDLSVEHLPDLLELITREAGRCSTLVSMI